MGRDFNEEIRQLRQKMKDIDNVIAYFERLEARLTVKDKRPRSASGPKSGTLLQMKEKPRSDRS
jgi:hypothetical protein